MEDAAYKDAAERILDLLRTEYGADFKSYFDGDPEEIGMSSYPAICVVAGASRIRQGGTGHDTLEQEVVVKVIFNKLDDFGASPDVDLTERKLRNIVLARAADGTWDTHAMAYYLRTQLTLSNTLLNSDIDIDPVTALRPTNGGAGMPMVTSEIHLSILTKQSILVANRV